MKFSHRLISKTLWLVALLVVASPALAEPGAVSIAQAPLDINALEQHFFSRLYDKDALDKRIQRLELLLFGATQDGNNVERLARVQEAAAERGHINGPNAASSGDAPAVAALEKTILKKSFSAESMSQRLARLESKVFGKPNPAMSVSDRVSRLKRTIGFDTPTISQYPPPIQETPNSHIIRPFGGFAYSSPFGPGNRSDEMTQQMNDMFRQLNRELRGIHRFPDGAPNVTPFMGPNGGPNITPFMVPNGGSPFVQPFSRQRSGQDHNTELPPYLDPNSI